VAARVLAALAVLVCALAPADAVFADPAGPTDYRSEIIGIEPPTPDIAVAILGGDSFIELTVNTGTDAVVVGYRGEPYLWFRPDGTVLENTLSPSTYLNAERYGTEFPDFADPDAEPEWREIGTGGRWSWHDHRGHLMQPIPPFGTQPGDRILESVVPLVVDGTEVDVTVISTWQPEPSSAPIWIGALLGAVVAMAGGALVARGGPVAAVAAVPVAFAVVAGAWQFTSLPAETGPRLTWWLLPVLAGVAALCALVPFVRRDRVIAPILLGLAGSLLVGWSWMRLDGLTAAIVPTDAPNWFDRGATVGVLIAGFGLVMLAVWELIAATRRPDRA
jgi:hypothetical protein